MWNTLPWQKDTCQSRGVITEITGIGKVKKKGHQCKKALAKTDNKLTLEGVSGGRVSDVGCRGAELHCGTPCLSHSHDRTAKKLSDVRKMAQT